MSRQQTGESPVRFTSRGRAVLLIAGCLLAGLVGYVTADWGLPGWSA